MLHRRPWSLRKDKDLPASWLRLLFIALRLLECKAEQQLLLGPALGEQECQKPKPQPALHSALLVLWLNRHLMLFQRCHRVPGTAQQN